MEGWEGGTSTPKSVSTATASMALADGRLVNRRVKVYWKLDDAWYTGRVAKFDPKNDSFRVHYDDGDKKKHWLNNEKWEELDVIAGTEGSKPGHSLEGDRCTPAKEDAEGLPEAEMPPEMLVGRRIRVFWEGDKEWYHGLINNYDDHTGMHRVLYDDGDVGEHVMSDPKERWELEHAEVAPPSSVLQAIPCLDAPSDSARGGDRGSGGGVDVEKDGSQLRTPASLPEVEAEAGAEAEAEAGAMGSQVVSAAAEESNQPPLPPGWSRVIFRPSSGKTFAQPLEHLIRNIPAPRAHAQQGPCDAWQVTCGK